MSFIEIPLTAGVFKDDTPLAAKGFFVDVDKGRFVRGRFQTISGWEAAADTDEVHFTGICRGVAAWKDNTGLRYAALGTSNAVTVMFDAVFYDITPIGSRGQLTNPFTTTLSSTSVNVDHASHGRAIGDRVNFDNATAVGGITIDGDYTVATAATNSYTITATTAATSGAGPGGGTVDYAYYIATGLIDSLGGSGYGTGGWGVGAYGISSAPSYAARTWSLDSWGQNLLASPRDGGIYEWSPMFTNVNLVTNGDFATGSAPWTYGTGWSWTGSAAAGTGPSAGNLTTTITLNPSAYFLLEADVTRTAGSVDFKIGNTVIGSAASSQHVKATFYTGTGSLAFSNPGTFAGRVDNISVKQLLNLSLLPNAPTQNACMLVTPERIVMVGGTIDSLSGLYNPLHVRWSDQDYNEAAALPGNQIWTAAATNQAGFYTLSKGGRVVGMKNGNSEVLVWTDDALYAARYVPDPNIVYSFRLVGQGCGLIGANAVAVLAGVAYWISSAGQFYRYAGGAPELLESTCARDVFSHLAAVQGDKVYASAVSAQQEIWWFYPDNRDGNECSRYIIYDVGDNCWVPGTFDRTAYLDAGIFQYPLAFSSAGYVYFQEKGQSADGTAMSWLASTGVVPIGNGNTLFGLRTVVPDFASLVGGMTLTIHMFKEPNDTPIVYGPYSITAGSTKIDLGPSFPTGKFAQFFYAGTAAPAFARQGVMQVDIYDTGATN